MLFVGLVVVAVQAVKNKSGTYHPYWCPQKDPTVARKHARKGKALEVPEGVALGPLLCGLQVEDISQVCTSKAFVSRYL